VKVADLRRMFPAWTWEAVREGRVFVYRGVRALPEGTAPDNLTSNLRVGGGAFASELSNVARVIVRGDHLYVFRGGGWFYRGSARVWDGLP
jgi:hypothetical protein